MWKSFVFGLFLESLLTSCAAGFGEDFACDKVDGLGSCINMNEVHQRIDAGETNGQTIQLETLPDFSSKPLHVDSGQPMRTPEYVQKMVIFPYIDAANHYHDSAVIYIVLEQHHWLGRPVQALRQEVD
jgi:hypothetical protein